MCSVSDEWRKPFSQHRHLVEDLVSIQTLAAVSFDDAIRIFEVSFDTRTKHVGHERVGGANSASPCFVFVCRSDAPQRSADFFVTESFFASMVQGTMVRKNQVRARTDLHALWRHFDSLLRQSIRF